MDTDFWNINRRISEHRNKIAQQFNDLWSNKETEEDSQPYEGYWTNWTPCTRNCVTRRYKYCKNYRKCPKKRIQQVAYCFVEGSGCENWVLNHVSMNNSVSWTTTLPPRTTQKVPTTTTTTMRPTTVKSRVRKPHRYTPNMLSTNMKKPWKKKSRCGALWNVTGGVPTNMLKIIGGMETPRAKWPWHVALMNRFKVRTNFIVLFTVERDDYATTNFSNLLLTDLLYFYYFNSKYFQLKLLKDSIYNFGN